MKANTFQDLREMLQEAMEKLAVVTQTLEMAGQPHRVKLSLKHAKEIRMLHKEGLTKEELASRYKVTVSCIKNVIYRVSWKEESK
jgi:hypothetical protein